MDRLSHRELTMKPGRLRRNVVGLVAGLSLGLGVFLLGGGVAHAQEAVWGSAMTVGQTSANTSVDSPVITPFEAVWG
jgi:hypothetical protein